MLRYVKVVKGKVGRFLGQAGYLPRTVGLIWTAAGWRTGLWAGLLVVQGLLPAGTVYLTRTLVDGLAEALRTEAFVEALGPVLPTAVLMGGLLLLGQASQGIMEWVRTAQSEHVRDYLNALIHEKAISVDLGYYESAEYHDRLYRARNDLQNRPLMLLESGGALVQSGITLLAVAGILLQYGPWLPLILLLSAVPALYVVVRHNRRYHRWWERTTEARRWAQYYDAAMTASSIAAEIRLFDLGTHFSSAYQRLRARLRGERIGLVRDRGLARLGASVVAALLSGTALAWMVWQSSVQKLTLGDLALFYQAFVQGQGLLRALLSHAGKVYESVLFLGSLFEFLDIEPEVAHSEPSRAEVCAPRREIRFRHVTFRYPGSERAVLEDFDLEVPAGKVVALVGANGAGKTTLVKLLCRFYDPESGSVEFDGRDLRDLPVGQLRRLITVLFQFPAPYYATAAENIAMGNISAPRDRKVIEDAAIGAGAHTFIERLPEGYDSMLGKWFAGGAELSGGEWQRLALARAFYRQAEIMILDEPTSFMDSWAEVDWFDRFRELAEGRTAIFITHRFLIAKRADIIYVMDQGQIVESGSHEELVAWGGRYAQSWQAQMEASAQSSASGEFDMTTLPPDPFSLRGRTSVQEDDA